MEHIGHRGAKREFPENTLAAFARAFERGADAIELDVHATRDGVVVVHHDPDLRHPPMGTATRAIAGLDWDTLRRVDLGGGARVPSLVEVFEAVPAGKTVYVELKGRNIEPAVASVVTAVVTSARVTCAVHSFDHDAIARMRTLAPVVPRGILFDRTPDDVAAAMRAAGARDVWPKWSLIDDAIVQQVHQAGGRVIAWTVNSRAEGQRLAAIGVDGLCTDDVRLIAGL